MKQSNGLDFAKETYESLEETNQESEDALRKKLRRVEDSYRRVAEQKLALYEQILCTEKMIGSSKADVAMNETAVKKLTTENKKLASQCTDLITRIQNWESNCSLYESERNALMDSGNEADEKAELAERKTQELEELLGKVLEELKLYKVNPSKVEENMLDSFLETYVKEECVESDRLLLQTTYDLECCRELLSMWDRLKPSSRKLLLLAAKMNSLKNDKESLRGNLARAEEEVNLLFRDNNFLEEENKKLIMKISKCGTKGNKRKVVDSTRPPLSPLPHNSKDL